MTGYADWIREGQSELAAITPERLAAFRAEWAAGGGEWGLGAVREADLDGPLCEACGEVVEDGASPFAPYCSRQCRRLAEHRAKEPR